MKTTKLLGRLWLVLVSVCATLGFVSCLDDGTETFPLEPGDIQVLAEGTWRVSTSELLDLATRKHVSDMPDDELLYSCIKIEDGTLVVQTDDDEWEIDAFVEGEDYYVYINDHLYRLTSLGKGRLSVETERDVNGEVFVHRYILDKVSSIERPDYSGDPEDTDRNDDENATSVVSSSESRTIIRGGYTLVVPKGAVPTNSDGEDGRVAFSLRHADADDLPASLPSGTTLVEGGNIKVEPMGFTFTSPLELRVPLQGFSPSDVALYRYDEASRRWVAVPWSKINDDGTASVSVLELGQFVLVKQSAEASQQMGGIHISSRYIEQGYYYYLTLTPTSLSSGQTRTIAFTANGKDLYMAGIPKGTYTAVVSREAREASQQAATGTQTYNEVIEVNVTNTLVAGSGGYDTYRGWTEISLSSDGWNSGRPTIWGDETVTYGTGKFQATLTWVNEAGNGTDYDLHLTTPSGEVYYGHMREGSFELDRDWLTGAGNAIENIYSINDVFAAGTYKVRVHHYSGATGKRFNCRILVNGVVVKSVTGVQDTGYADIYTFTIE